MSLPTTSNATAQWGVPNSVTYSSGVVLSYRERTEAVTADEENSQGAVTGIVTYDTRTTAELTVQAESSATLPSFESELTVNGKKFIVESAEVAYSNKSFKTISIRARRSAAFPSSGSN